MIFCVRFQGSPIEISIKISNPYKLMVYQQNALQNYNINTRSVNIPIRATTVYGTVECNSTHS
jgi:hypothetical protein